MNQPNSHCPFARCNKEEVVACDGACHGVLPDGSPLDMTEFKEHDGLLYTIADYEALMDFMQDKVTKALAINTKLLHQ